MQLLRRESYILSAESITLICTNVFRQRPFTSFSLIFVGGFHNLHFPGPAKYLRYAKLKTNTPNLHAFTICFWSKTISASSGPILSYGTQEYQNSIEISNIHDGVGLSVTLGGTEVLGADVHTETTPPTDGMWHHWCVQWRAPKGYTQYLSVFKDGNMAAIREVNVGHIPGGRFDIEANKSITCSWVSKLLLHFCRISSIVTVGNQSLLTRCRINFNICLLYMGK